MSSPEPFITIDGPSGNGPSRTLSRQAVEGFLRFSPSRLGTTLATTVGILFLSVLIIASAKMASSGSASYQDYFASLKTVKTHPKVTERLAEIRHREVPSNAELVEKAREKLARNIAQRRACDRKGPYDPHLDPNSACFNVKIFCDAAAMNTAVYGGPPNLLAMQLCSRRPLEPWSPAP
jgi:hypothetical protein